MVPYTIYQDLSCEAVYVWKAVSSMSGSGPEMAIGQQNQHLGRILSMKQGDQELTDSQGQQKPMRSSCNSPLHLATFNCDDADDL